MSHNGNRTSGKGILGRWDATTDEICDAMAVGVARALREHKRAGNSIAVWDHEHDRVRIIPPEEIDVPDEADGELDETSRAPGE